MCNISIHQLSNDKEECRTIATLCRLTRISVSISYHNTSVRQDQQQNNRNNLVAMMSGNTKHRKNCTKSWEEKHMYERVLKLKI